MTLWEVRAVWRSRMRLLTAESSALLRWWLEELRSLLQDSVDRLIPGLTSRTVITLTELAGTLTHVQRGRESKSVAFQLDGSGSLPIHGPDLVEDPMVRRSRSQIVIPGSAVLVRHLWLPAGASQNLDAVIELQLERDLPVTRDQVYVDWHIAERRDGPAQIRVAIAVARRSEIDSIRNVTQSWGLRPISIGLVDELGVPEFDFISRIRSGSSVSLGRIDRILIICSAFLALAMLGTAIGDAWHQRSSLSAELAATAVQASKVDQRLEQLRLLSAPIKALNRRMSVPAVPEILADLTHALPDDSWVFQLEIRAAGDESAEVRLSAFAPVATTLTDALQNSPQFRSVELVGASASGLAGVARDRVEIRAEWAVDELSTPTRVSQ